MKNFPRQTIKYLSKNAVALLVFGVMMIIGIVVALSFTEPESGPSFSEPDNFQEQGGWYAYGRGWVANSSGDGSVKLSSSTCESAAGWVWFEDANGDGDTIDEEDGLCVATITQSTGLLNWNGDDCSNDKDNSYIPKYTCVGSFPSGTVSSEAGLYQGWNDVCAADNTWNEGDCAICQADCYDGKKDLPDQGGYTSPSDATDGGCEGPVTTEVLKNWVGTRLPTSQDFFGFCGAASGDADDAVGDSNYYATGASTDKTIGDDGHNIGRGGEYIYLSNSANYEWLSERRYDNTAHVAGYDACSRFFNLGVNNNNPHFRAVFRP